MVYHHDPLGQFHDRWLGGVGCSTRDPTGNQPLVDAGVVLHRNNQSDNNNPFSMAHIVEGDSAKGGRFQFSLHLPVKVTHI